MPKPCITVQQHILQEQQRFPGATGEFSWLLSGITLATKLIQARIRMAALENVLGEAGRTNVQGEIQQKLDIYADQMLLHCLGCRTSVGVLASEENEKPILLREASPEGQRRHHLFCFPQADRQPALQSGKVAAAAG
jgi:fructose-1,6-bisphosphatase I